MAQQSVFDVRWPRVLAAAVLAVSTWIAVQYSGQRIVDGDHFRQTETAATAFWMLREGWQLAYQTPVWGFPWSAPIEFPIYQALVALVVRVTELPLEQVGRLVSFAFLVGFAWPAVRIRARLGLHPDIAWVFCALLWSCPLYVVWGRTFMIESTALFFTLAAIPYVLDLREEQPSPKAVAGALFWGSLGMLQRSITAGPTLLVLAIVVLVAGWRTASPRARATRFARLAIGVGTPLAIGVAWTVYADIVKSQNFVGQTLMHNFRMSDAYVGTLAQRFDLGILKEIFWGRMIAENGGGVIGLILLGGAMVSRNRSDRMVVGICGVLAAFPVMLFLEVSRFLSYYQVASQVFLVAAVAYSCIAWLPSVMRWRGAAPAAALALVLYNGYVFRRNYFDEVRSTPDVTSFRGLAVADLVQRFTPQHSAVLAFGVHDGLSSFCPEIPYLSQRKGFTVPDFREQLADPDPASFLGGSALGAMVFCSATNKERYNRLIDRYSDSSAPRLYRVSGCYVWLPHATAVTSSDGTPLLPTRHID